jgi:predicted alpha/beta-hydrolase family hydrolase
MTPASDGLPALRAGQVREIATPLGPARAHLYPPTGGLRAAVGTLLLGHGAGGGVDAPDIRAAARAAVAAGWAVALVEQPWRVAGRKVAPPPPRLDEGWTAVVDALGHGRGRLPAPYVFGGRSAGARVACRLAAPLGAKAVVTLAFPLHPPGKPERSRVAELLGAVTAGLPVLVVQGERDPFGTPEEVRAALPRAARRGVRLVAVPGDHGLKPGAVAAGAAVRDFLTDLSG